MCNNLHAKDNLNEFGISELKNSLTNKRKVPKNLPSEISEPIRDIFDGLGEAV